MCPQRQHSDGKEGRADKNGEPRQTYNMGTLLWEGMTSAEPEAVDRQIKPSDIYTGANEGNVQTKKLTACCML